MKNKVNIFLCHNPFHVFISTQLCLTRFADGGYENVIITTTPQLRKVEGLTYLHIPKKMPGRLSQMWRAKRLVTRFSDSYKSNLEIFLPHVVGVLGNWIFSSSRLRKNGTLVSFYYEGAVMIDPKRVERPIHREEFKRAVLSALLLHKFVNYPDLLPMHSGRIHKVYTPYPERTPAPETKKELISFPRHDVTRNSGGILVIGVDAGKHYEESVRNLISFISNDKSYRHVYFKPHYADKEKVFENLAAKTSFAFTMVQDARCIEEVIGDLAVDAVICTQNSSALLNLKSIYKDDLRVIFYSHAETPLILGEEFINMIKSIGVEIIMQQTNGTK